MTIKRFFSSVVSLELKRDRLIEYARSTTNSISLSLSLSLTVSFASHLDRFNVKFNAFTHCAIGNEVVTNSLAFITKTVDHDTVSLLTARPNVNCLFIQMLKWKAFNSGAARPGCSQPKSAEDYKLFSFLLSFVIIVRWPTIHRKWTNKRTL